MRVGTVLFIYEGVEKKIPDRRNKDGLGQGSLVENEAKFPNSPRFSSSTHTTLVLFLDGNLRRLLV